MWIAEEYFLAELPDGWVEAADAATGRLYYHSPYLNRSQWQHPLEGYYRGLVFMRMEGSRLLAERARRAPPTDQVRCFHARWRVYALVDAFQV